MTLARPSTWGGRRPSAPGPRRGKNVMQIAVHIAFYYDESRIQYLDRVLTNLHEIGAYHKLHIYIHCNRRFRVDHKFANINTEVIAARFLDVPGLRRFYGYLPYGLRRRVDPLYLSWNHRKYILDTIDIYDVQIYLEDDIGFNNHNFEYWYEYKDICINNGYNLGFLRVEFDGRSGRWYCTDLMRAPGGLIEVGGRLFARSAHYYGFWIYDRDELRRFAASDRWDLEHAQAVREVAALGWHRRELGLYKDTIVPVKQELEKRIYTVSKECSVHHMPNNYIGHPMFCTVEFPPRIMTE
jgi:hypothetical protein